MLIRLSTFLSEVPVNYKESIISYLMLLVLSSGYGQNVGLGTTTPEALLHIRSTRWIKTIFENDAGQPRGYIGTDNNGTVTIAANAFWNGNAWVYPNAGASFYMLMHRVNNQFEFRVRPDGGNQNTAMVINQFGRVGIGTTNPQQMLSVGGGMVIDQNNLNTGSSANILSFGGVGGEGLGSKRNGGPGMFGLDFYTNNLRRMTISNNGNVGIGTSQPDNSAALDISSTNKAFYPPRLTTIQRNAMASPKAGAVVFDQDKKTLYLHNGSEWLPLGIGDKTQPPLISYSTDPTSCGIYNSLGYSVDVEGDFIVAGAPEYAQLMPNFSCNRTGAVVVYKKMDDVWTQWAIIKPDSTIGNARFGHSVSLSGSTLLIGIPQSTVTGLANAGSAELYDLSGGAPVKIYTFTAGADKAANDRFGWSVSIDGPRIVIGAPNKDIAFSNQGAAYMFDLNLTFPLTVSSRGRLSMPSGAKDNDLFGSSVSIAKNFVLVGAPKFDKEALTDNGAALFYERSGNSWVVDTIFYGQFSGDYTGYATNIHYINLAQYVPPIDVYNAVVGSPGYNDGASAPDHGVAMIYKYFSTLPVWTGSNATYTNLYSYENRKGLYYGAAVTNYGDGVAAGCPARLTFAGEVPGLLPNGYANQSFVFAGALGSEPFRYTDGIEVPTFGNSVARDLNTIVIGFPNKNKILITRQPNSQ